MCHKYIVLILYSDVLQVLGTGTRYSDVLHKYIVLIPYLGVLQVLGTRTRYSDVLQVLETRTRYSDVLKLGHELAVEAAHGVAGEEAGPLGPQHLVHPGTTPVIQMLSDCYPVKIYVFFKNSKRWF